MKKLLLILLLLLPCLADVLSSVTFDGNPPVKTLSIMPQGKLYLEVSAIASAHNIPVVDKAGGTFIVFGGKTINDIQRYNGKTYVNAGALAQAFGMEVRASSNGQVVDFKTKAAAAAPPQQPPQQQPPAGEPAPTPPPRVGISLVKKEKITSATPGNYQLVLTVDISSSAPLELPAQAFVVIDDKRQQTPASGGFAIDVKGQARADRLVFDVSQRTTVQQLVIIAKDGRPLATLKL